MNRGASQRPPAWRRAAAVAFGLVAGGAVLEAAVRLGAARAASRARWSDRPLFYYAPLDSPVVHDFRHEREKPAGIFRIAAIGDSFTYAPGLQFDDAYPKRLERMLNLNGNGCVPGRLRAEVLNYGRWGAGTADEVPILERALRARPDLVLLEITLNDAQGPDYPREVQRSFRPFDPERHLLFRSWRTLAVVAERLEATRSQRRYADFHRRLFEDPRTFGPFERAIGRMKERCDRAGAKLAAVVFPFVHFPMDDSYPLRGVHHRIARLLRSLGVPALDLLPAFRGIPPERLVLEPDGDRHPNEIAHRIAAERIELWLEEEDLVPEPLRVREKFASRSADGDKRGARRFAPPPGG